MPNPTNYSVELKERTMQLAPRIMFFPAKEAKACGLTREEYTVSDELKAKLETVKNPNNKVVTATQGSKEETEKYKNKVQAAVSTQTMFARYAVNQARNSLPKNASLPMLAQYVAQNTSELISAYKHECMKNIESKPMSQSEKDKAIGRLNYSIKSLRGQTDLETSMEDTMKEVYNQIAPEDARVKTADYQPNQFTATRLDSQPLDEQEIAVFRQNMKQTAMVLSQYHTEVQQPEAPRSPQSDIHIGQNNTTQTQEEIRMNTSNAFERHVVEDKSEIRASLEAVAHKNEGMVQAYTQHLSDKFPKEKAEAIAVSNVLLANMKDAVLGGKELPPADKYLKEYHVIPEESAARIAEKFEKITGINLETYDQMVESSKEPNKDADKQIADKNIEVYRDKLESLIKDEVQRAVSTGMKEKISQQNLDRNDER